MPAFCRRSIIAFPCLAALTFLAGCAGFTMFDTVKSLMQQGRGLYFAKKYNEAIAKFETARPSEPLRTVICRGSDLG